MRFIHHDRRGNPVDGGSIHTPIAATLTQSTDGTETLSLTCIDHIDKDDRIIYQDDEGTWHEHIATTIDEQRSDTIPYTKATCESSLIETAGNIIHNPTLTGTATTLVDQALQNSGWQRGTIQNSGTTQATLDIGTPTTPEMLEAIANAFNLEIRTHVTLTNDKTRIASRIVDLLALPGDNTGQEFRYNRNLSQIRRTIGDTHPVTRLWVYGKTNAGETQTKTSISTVNNGHEYIDANQETLQQWGRRGADDTITHYEALAEFPDIDDPATLLQAGQQRLKELSQPVISYEASVQSLALGGLNPGNVRIGDTVRIVDDTFTPALRLEGRILKLERDLLANGVGDTITIGTIAPSITESIRNVESTVQQLWSSSGAWDDSANLTTPYVDAVINGLNENMNRTGGYVYLTPGEGITVYDRPIDQDPTMAIQLGGGYFRIADSKKSDGTWDWRTMGTGSGLVADLIVAGVIRGGANEWNLETGELSFRDGVIRSMDGRSVWDLTNSTFRTNNMKATNIDASGQITSTSGGTSAAIRGGTMTYSNSAGGRFSITNDRLSSGSSWVNLVADNVDSLVFHNETNDSHDSVYIMCGPGYINTTKLSLMYGQFASLDCNDDNDLIISDNGAQINSNGFLTLQCDQLTSGEKLLDFGQGTSSDSDIWIGMPRNSYRPCLRIGSSVCQISCNDVNRVDLSSTYAALVHGDYHVMVNSSGVSQTTRAASATSLQATLLEREFERLADEGVDLSDPSGYSVQPAAVDEIRLGQVHDILRLLVDGDTEGAKSMLDQAESEQHVWTQAELDAFDATGRSDHPTGMADRDREAYRVMTAPYEGKENGDE